MNYVIGLLSVILALDCLLLILLVLIQLPKKEAGAGVAFGGSATDALFGAGSGNALTNLTKYATGIFFALAILISLLQAQSRKSAATLSPSFAPAHAPAAPAPSQPTPSTVTAPVINTNATLSIPAIPATTTATNVPTP